MTIDNADWASERLEEDPNFHRKITFSDVVYFLINGYVNKQNCHIWDDTNLNEVHQVAMHPQKITVWYGFWAGGVIGSYFFENDVGGAITVNGYGLRSMWRALQIDHNQFILARIGHTANATIDILHERFEGMVISRRADVNWPPRSYD